MNKYKSHDAVATVGSFSRLFVQKVSEMDIVITTNNFRLSGYDECKAASVIM